MLFNTLNILNHYEKCAVYYVFGEFKLREIRTKLFIHTHRVLNGRAFAVIQEGVLIKSYW